MLASAIHMQENTKLRANMKFKNTEVYFDTPLLMYALGYSGEAFKEACNELIRLLKVVGAQLCFFEHNEDELKGILDAHIELYKNNKLGQSYNYDYFIQNNITPVQVNSYKYSLRQDLIKLGFQFKDKPNFDKYERNIDWEGFDKYISKNIAYKKDTRRANDIESITAMYRLRDRDDYRRIESCRAIFVATNPSLVYYTRRYFSTIGGRIIQLL